MARPGLASPVMAVLARRVQARQGGARRGRYDVVGRGRCGAAWQEWLVKSRASWPGRARQERLVKSRVFGQGMAGVTWCGLSRPGVSRRVQARQASQGMSGMAWLVCPGRRGRGGRASQGALCCVLAGVSSLGAVCPGVAGEARALCSVLVRRVWVRQALLLRQSWLGRYVLASMGWACYGTAGTTRPMMLDKRPG